MIYFIGTILFYLLGKRKFNPFSHLINITFLLYIPWLMSLTIFPIPIDSRLIQSFIETNTEARNSFIPLQTISMSISGAIEQGYFSGFIKGILGNIIMMIPLGFYLPFIKPKLNSFRNILIVGIIAATSIEITQKVISLVIGASYRSFDVDDIILNTIGVLLGSIALRFINPIVKRLKDDIEDNHSETITS
ncbi:VanZ family protein [Rossellomorea aquimaris]|uniref:VanZ family protein n=1 Tax=Rossellomorea aquimaris TaxID=189382 RepID=UPI001CD70755|nr:VanZ family protein [Rossellomorea aquimaris]MCA1054195.1 VanZ family protein [Rossellomorea aquimaris]